MKTSKTKSYNIHARAQRNISKLKTSKTKRRAHVYSLLDAITFFVENKQD